MRVSGEWLERFLNLAISQGIYFWDVRRRDGQLTARMGVWAFHRIRPIARKSRCRVRITRRAGLPFLLRRAAGRRLLLLSAAAMVLLLYISSSFIWVVEVRGLKTLPEEKVFARLAGLGLRPGAYKGHLDPERLANALPLEMREIAWAGIHIEGTRAVVEVAEKTLLPEQSRPEGSPGDIVAARDGLITQILALAGEPLVRAGDTVRQGQVLIRGIVNPWGEGAVPEKGALPPAPVRARGIVRARVWYDTYVEMPLVIKTAVRTGKVYSRRLVRFAGREVVLSGRWPVRLADYQLEETRLRPPRWRNTSFPVEFIHLRYYEVVRRSQVIGRTEAITRAEAEAKRRLMERIPVQARILKESTQVVQDDGRLVGFRMVIEVEEDIGRLEVAGGEPAGRGESGEGSLMR